MALRRLALVVSLSASVAAGACGFTEEGALDVPADGGVLGPMMTGDANGPSSSEGGSDGSSGSTVDGPSSGVPVCSPPTCPLPSPPAGWATVLYGTSRTDACPAGFDSADALESPVAGADACACNTCVTTGTNCNTGPIPTAFDNGGGACGATGAQHQTNNALCRAQSGSFGQDARVDAPTAVLGTCTAAATPVPAKVATQARRICTPQAATCAGVACAAPASMKACVASAGDVACPSGTKHLVGAAVTLACPSCGCSVTAATCGGKLGFYPSSNCGGTPVVLNVGVCTATGSASFVSTKWTGTVASEVCTTTSVAPTTTLTGMQTVCCP